MIDGKRQGGRLSKRREKLYSVAKSAKFDHPTKVSSWFKFLSLSFAFHSFRSLPFHSPLLQGLSLVILLQHDAAIRSAVFTSPASHRPRRRDIWAHLELASCRLLMRPHQMQTPNMQLCEHKSTGRSEACECSLLLRVARPVSDTVRCALVRRPPIHRLHCRWCYSIIYSGLGQSVPCPTQKSQWMRNQDDILHFTVLHQLHSCHWYVSSFVYAPGTDSS